MFWRSESRFSSPPIINSDTSPRARTATSKLKSSALIAGAVLSTAFAAGAAQAAESVIPLTPAGGTDVGQALLPATPGLYGAIAILPFNQDDRVYDIHGVPAKDSGNVRLNMQTVAFGLNYVYPEKLFGGTIASDVSIPLTSQNSKIGFTSNVNHSNVGDVYSDLLNWSRHIGPVAPGAGPGAPGLTVAFSMAMKFPTGPFSAKDPVNIGNNVFVFIPTAAVTYTAGGIPGFSKDTQFSAKVFYGIPTENNTVHYQSGNATSVDFSTTAGFGFMRAGFAGTFADQTTDDRPPAIDRPPEGPAVPAGKRFEQLQIGPVFTFAIPNTKLSLKFKYLQTVFVRNDINDQFLLAAVGYKF
jgi:hypothetical protein